jgi:hypothetical protein
VNVDDVVVFIPCAGDQERWANHLGYSKHLVPVVNREPLLHRTIRQLNERHITPWVVGKANDARYIIEGSNFFEAALDPRLYGQGRFRTSEALYNYSGRTIEFLGDVFFTDEAMDTILSDERRGWRVYGRIGASKFTGCEYGEIFAHSFYAEDIPKLIDVSDYIIRGIEIGLVTPGASHWDLYCWMARCSSWDYKPECFTIIDDFTEDFDYPHDYDTWKNRYGLR